MSFLTVSGTKIVDEEGNQMILRGAGLGGWLTMENFISGFPGCEFQIREALVDVLGQAKSEFFFDRFLTHFFADSDASFFRSLHLNSIRIALNYRHLISPLDPTAILPNAFTHLDRAIALCAQNQIYTIIDMHTAPGGQNGGWHSDHGSHIAGFWIHKDFQDRLVWLWTEIAKRYKDNPWVAGYNPLNEPADPKHDGLVHFYDRVHDAIRKVDQRHMLFLDGNTFATDFTKFPDDAGSRWVNSAYAIHDYSIYGFPKSPEPYDRTEAQKEKLVQTYKRKRAWMDERELCVWNGEWGPVYARREYDGDATDSINARRYNVLKDQLEIYQQDQLSWSIWLYKDIGHQGMVYVSPDTPYMKHFKAFLLKKYRLSVDAWGADDKFVKHVYDPIVDFIKEAVPDEANRKLYPPIWSVEERVSRIARTELVAEFLVKEWAELFREMEEEKLEEFAKSFAFENCLKRDGLNKVLREHATSVGLD